MGRGRERVDGKGNREGGWEGEEGGWMGRGRGRVDGKGEEKGNFRCVHVCDMLIATLVCSMPGPLNCLKCPQSV